MLKLVQLEVKKVAKDVRFHMENGTYKLRACGVIELNGKYLVDCTKINNFYSFPGGHIKFGETSEDAAIREVQEETGIKVKSKKLLSITEVFLGDTQTKMLHEIDFHYLMEPVDYTGPLKFSSIEFDNGKKKKHLYRFMTLEEMSKKDIRPESILDILRTKKYGQHLIQDKRKNI